MRFRATIQLDGKTATGITVPDTIVASLSSGKRLPVRVTINDAYTYRSTIASMGGVFKLPVSAEVRAGAGVAAGDDVEVDIELDTAPREVAVPPDLAEALADEADARRFFDGLSYSNKQRIVRSIEEAKTPETRQKRIAKAVDMLRSGNV